MNFFINTAKKQELIDITARINETIRKSRVEYGLCNIFVRHTTAAVIINENDDPNICDDFLKALNKIIPDNAGYLHDRIDGNAGAHIKASLLSPGVTVPVEHNKLSLGKWQAVMLVELDGPRQNREIEINIFGL